MLSLTKNKTNIKLKDKTFKKRSCKLLKFDKKIINYKHTNLHNFIHLQKKKLFLKLAAYKLVFT